MEMIIELSEQDLKRLVYDYIEKKLGVEITDEETTKVKILVKSKQNYKSEWEEANFKAVYTSFK